VGGLVTVVACTAGVFLLREVPDHPRVRPPAKAGVMTVQAYPPARPTTDFEPPEPSGRTVPVVDEKASRRALRHRTTETGDSLRPAEPPPLPEKPGPQLERPVATEPPATGPSPAIGSMKQETEEPTERSPVEGKPLPAAVSSGLAEDQTAGSSPRQTDGFSPRTRAIMVAENPHHIMRGGLDLPYVCLTFDGSALNNGTEPILRILRDKDVAATFFLSGEFLEHFPADVRAIAAAGHEVGSHLYRHVHLTTWEENRRHDLRPGVTRERVHDLLQRNESLYTHITGETMSRLWRAPYGETNSRIDAWAGELGYLHVGWTRDYARGKSMDALDWISRPEADGYMTAAQIRDRLLAFDEDVPGGANGAIILLHLGTQRREEQPWLVLEEVIDGFRSKGYAFVTVSELVRETVRLAEEGLPPLVHGPGKTAPIRTRSGTVNE